MLFTAASAYLLFQLLTLKVLPICLEKVGHVARGPHAVLERWNMLVLLPHEVLHILLLENAKPPNLFFDVHGLVCSQCGCACSVLWYGGE